jgi:hypothetical protein
MNGQELRHSLCGAKSQGPIYQAAAQIFLTLLLPIQALLPAYYLVISIFIFMHMSLKSIMHVALSIF